MRTLAFAVEDDAVTELAVVDALAEADPTFLRGRDRRPALPGERSGRDTCTRGRTSSTYSPGISVMNRDGCE